MPLSAKIEGEKFKEVIRLINQSLGNLREIKRRLDTRIQELQSVTEKTKANKTWIEVYQIEIKEIEKVIKIIGIFELALTQITLRLETLYETRETFQVIKIALHTVKEVGRNLTKATLDLNKAVREIDEVFKNVLEELKMVSPQVKLQHTSYEGLVESAAGLVKEKVKVLRDFEREEQFSYEGIEEIVERAKVALLAAEGGGRIEIELFPAVLPEDERIDKLVLNYVNQTGSTDPEGIASALGISREEAVKSIIRLSSKNLLRGGKR